MDNNNIEKYGYEYYTMIKFIRDFDISLDIDNTKHINYNLYDTENKTLYYAKHKNKYDINKNIIIEKSLFENLDEINYKYVLIICFDLDMYYYYNIHSDDKEIYNGRIKNNKFQEYKNYFLPIRKLININIKI